MESRSNLQLFTSSTKHSLLLFGQFQPPKPHEGRPIFNLHQPQQTPKLHQFKAVGVRSMFEQHYPLKKLEESSLLYAGPEFGQHQESKIPDGNPIFGRYPTFSSPEARPAFNYHQEGTYQRPNFPTFKGKDVQGWVHRVEQLLDYFNIEVEQRVRMVALYLEDGLLVWYRWVLGSIGRPLSWCEFVYGLDAMYGKSATVDYFAELTNLKQEGYAFDQY